MSEPQIVSITVPVDVMNSVVDLLFSLPAVQSHHVLNALQSSAVPNFAPEESDDPAE